MKILGQRYVFPSLIFAVLIIHGCTARYFRDAGPPPAPVPRSLQNWPYHEYWTGIVFNGAKIGFTHLRLQPAKKAPGRFDLRSKAYFRFRLLMFDKTIHLRAYNRIAADLTLQSFEYDYNLDGNRQQLIGKRHDGRLEYLVISRGSSSKTSIPLDGPLYSTACIHIYPVLNGLEVGRHYKYPVFDGETRTIQIVEQKILAFEESDLFEGPAYKMKTRMQGQEVTTWLDPQGRPVLEMSMGGVIISALESKLAAQRYLAEAAFNKEETIIDFSLIRTQKLLKNPEKISDLTIQISSKNADIQMIQDDRQQCKAGGRTMICRIRSRADPAGGSGEEKTPGNNPKYLLPSSSIPTGHPRVQILSKSITEGKQETEQKMKALIEWIKRNIRQEPVDSFTAIDVLEGKRAECQGHALLYTALARSSGIPSRVVNGIVYSADFKGFLYHAWAESLVEDRWVAVDPTLHQYPADATHFKFVEGENPSDLLPLINLIGNLRVEILHAVQ